MPTSENNERGPNRGTAASNQSREASVPRGSAVNTNIPVSNREAQVYKEFANLSVNEEIKEQGDGNIRISPFDDYVLFTMYEEIDGEDKPIDLSNVGQLYLSFVGSKDEIRILYYTNVKDLDLSAGQVLFRITKEDGKKILAIDNNIFYVSSMMTSKDGSNSDESVIYTGTFSSLNEAAANNLTGQIKEDRLKFSKEIAVLRDENETYRDENTELTQIIGELQNVMNLFNSNSNELANEIDILTKDSKSQKIVDLLRRNQEALRAAREVKLKIAKIKSLQNINSTGLSKPNLTIAADNLQKLS